MDVPREILTEFYIHEEVPIKQEARQLRFLFHHFLASADKIMDIHYSWVPKYQVCMRFSCFIFSSCVWQKTTYISRVPTHFLGTGENMFCAQSFSEFRFRNDHFISFHSSTSLTSYCSKPLPSLSIPFTWLKEQGTEGRSIEAHVESDKAPCCQQRAKATSTDKSEADFYLYSTFL